MIFITVKSDFLEAKRQFETDKEATLYLKMVKKLHDTQRNYLYSRVSGSANLRDKSAHRRLFMKACLPCKVSIHNVKFLSTIPITPSITLKKN